MVAKVRDRLAVSKQTTQIFHMQRVSRKKLNEVKSKEKYRVEISNRFAALENLSAEVDIHWETIRENIKIPAEESLYRGINEFEGSDEHIRNLVKDENGDMLADSHNILNKWKNYFSQLLTAHRVSDVRRIEIRTAVQLVYFEVEIGIAKLKMYKSSGSDQIPAGLIQAEGETLRSEIHKLINSICNKE
jgi:hypothetical protein